MVNAPHPLFNDAFRTAIERVVSDYRGTKWEMKEFRDMNDFSSHPSAILSDGACSVFVKLSTAANGQEQFEIEQEGLRFLTQTAGVRTPAPIAILPSGNGVVMVLEGVQELPRTSMEWRQIGQTIAKIHENRGTQFGLDTHNYFGPFYQDNRPLPDWSTFYAERRLWPRFMGAINAGHLPTDVIRQVEKLILRIPDLCASSVVPTLLHGDAQQNNFITPEVGTAVIDPAVYYGHPEMDLAHVDFFRPVSDELFEGYRERLPIDSGFWERRELWRIYGYLAVVEVDGASYLPKLIDAVRKYS
jgi:fructosamine-3-kinase